MIGITVSSAARCCGGTVVPSTYEDRAIGDVIIDSRLVKPGDIFVAYKGEKADGHDYIPVAFEKGAACVLAEHLPAQAVSGAIIIVDDVQRALEQLCALCREKLSLPVVGITGSVGKTSAKEMIWSVLSQRMNVHKTDKNLNNQIGVPMTVSRIHPEHQAAVIEMGISNFGDMATLAPMSMPDIMVYTVIGHAHLEFLGDLDGVLRAKTELLPLIKQDALLILNGDDEYLRKIDSPHKKLFFGLKENNQLRAENIQALPDGKTSCRIIYPQGHIDVLIPAFGQHMVYAALAGAAVGLSMGLSPEEIAAGISRYETVGRRAAITDTGFLTLIDDCYNANPDSVSCGIDSLMKLSGRHVCILGDMLELGENSPQLHRLCGAEAVDKGVDLVLSCGELGRFIAEAAGDKGLYFDDRATLISHLPEQIKKGDRILVKASRGAHFEDISEALKLLGV